VWRQIFTVSTNTLSQHASTGQRRLAHDWLLCPLDSHLELVASEAQIDLPSSFDTVVEVFLAALQE
jgi:hypothetical protein